MILSDQPSATIGEPDGAVIGAADYLAWLQDPSAKPVLLIKAWPLINGVPTLITMGTRTFPIAATGAPTQTHYPGICRLGSAVQESLALQGGAGKLSAGDIEIDNVDGSRDGWLNYVWSNCPVEMYFGDLLWDAGSFKLVFAGQAASNLDSRDRDVLNIKLRDKMDRLNMPVTEVKLGGATTNKDEVLPLPFGEVHNMTPLLESEADLTYRVSLGRVRQISEVRDNGVPVGFIPYPLIGQFKLTQAPVGTITCSVMGDETGGVYVSTIADVIERLVTTYGNVNTRFSAAEIDRTSFDTFDARVPYLIGYNVDGRTNTSSACQDIAASVGAQLVPTRDGKLRLLQVQLPPPGPIVDIPETWIAQETNGRSTLRIAERPEVAPAVKLGFAKNWTVQEGLQTSLPAEHIDLYATEFLTETSVDATVQSLYKLSADPTQQNGYLMRRVDAAVEALRQRNLYKVQRTVFEFTGEAPCLQFELGSSVRLFSSRFSLSEGVEGMVIGFKPDWQNRKVVMQVIV
jgi:hypothetical protein